MNKHLDQLTWLRGLAAFFVVCSHVLQSTDPVYQAEGTLSLESPLRLLDLGTFGVLLFFVLSGCTLTVSNGLFFQSRRYLSGYFVKRFFRIWPAFFVSVLSYSLFRPVFQSFYPDVKGFWIEYQFLNPVTGYDYLSYLSLTFNFTGEGGQFNNAYWSLPIEFQYYLLFPLLLLSLRYFSVLGPALIGILLYFLPQMVDLSPVIDKKLFLLAYSFCGGVLLGYIYIVAKGRIRINSYIAASIVAGLFLLNGCVSNDFVILPNIIFISNKWNFYSVSGLAITGTLLFTGITLPARIDRVLTKMGELSYSTYLLHNIVIAVAIPVVLNLGLLDYKIYIVSISALSITYVLSFYMHRYVEKPGISLGRYFSSRLIKG
jgi:peptidoglycan/LPS O-acetylase OafA/YrhL